MVCSNFEQLFVLSNLMVFDFDFHVLFAVAIKSIDIERILFTSQNLFDVLK